MNATEFAEALVLCAPSINELKQKELTLSECEDIRKSYIPLLKSNAARSDLNPIADLAESYDVNKIEIGMVRFNDLKKVNGKLVFGKVEADPLMINLETGEIEVEESGASGHIIFHCAIDAASFLAAMITAASFLGQCLWNPELSCDKDAAQSAASKCIVLAGGERYSTFYYTLLGAL